MEKTTLVKTVNVCHSRPKKSALLINIILLGIMAISVISGITLAAPVSASSVTGFMPTSKPNSCTLQFVDYGDKGFFIVISGNDLIKAKKSASGAWEVSQQAAGLFMDRYFTGLNILSAIEKLASAMKIDVPLTGFGSAGKVEDVIKTAIAYKIYGFVKTWAPYARSTLCVGARHTGSGIYRPLEWYYTIN